MTKKDYRQNIIKNVIKLFPTMLGIDEYDINLKKLNNNNKEDFDCVSICIITIICFVMYVSLSKSLTIDEFL